MDLLQNLLDQSQYAFLTAIILGLMTAISPCPLATNITAIGFIGKDLENRKKVFLNGVLYTLGRVVGYTGLALLLYLGADKMDLSRMFQGWGEKALGPLLLFAGLVMFDLIRLKIPGFGTISDKMGEKAKSSYWSAFALGILFALAFCPYSGVLYFVLLIPMTLSSQGGLFLPVLYALATALPVLIFAWLLAYAVGRVGTFYKKLKSFEWWFRRAVAIVFIGTGLFYLYQWIA